MLEFRAFIQTARQQHMAGAGTVLDVMLRTGSYPLDQILTMLAQDAGVSALEDSGHWVADFARLSQAQGRSLRAVLLSSTRDQARCLAMADPWNDEQLRQASAALGGLPEVAAATGAQLDGFLGPSASTKTPSAASVATATGPIVGFVDSALRAAYELGASDVHFECDRQGVSVKFRHDGVMGLHARLAEPSRAQEVISRIKVMAQLDITEQRTPQDGRLRFSMTEQNAIDMRVSIMPSVFGEDAVLRLLDKAQLRAHDNGVSLDKLGFDTLGRERILDLASLPHGMLLFTGPTGSGKTTTVYAVLSELHTGQEKVITIEDPVEYELPGVLQIPVNERKGLTFAKGLRSILRHDPDRILVGEIRDAETAEIAVQSALTGHQVFTTVHANSLFDVTGRFKHFDLDMFGFMSSLNGVVVQRLIRCLCPSCAGSRIPTAKEASWFDNLGVSCPLVPVAHGCPLCRGTGFKGRSVIAEVHRIDDTLRDLVTTGAPIGALRTHVGASGVLTLAHRAAELMMQGRTSPEEIRRVVGQ
jgi:general secretion pathway protein E